MDNSQPIEPTEKIKKRPHGSIFYPYKLKHKIGELVTRLKEHKGDPHYIAMGMAIGAFIAMTPTIPFHMVIAVTLAFAFRCSKAGAFIAVWISNPITVPFLYYGSYKVGMFFIGNSTPFNEKYESIIELIHLGLKATIAMIAGGIILGIPVGLAAYFITRIFIVTYRSRRK